MQTTVDYQSELSSILKRKAVGPKGSRHLNEDDLRVIMPALESGEVTLVSKAVLVASVCILDRNKLEQDLLESWESGKYSLPDELTALFFEKSNSDFGEFLQRIVQNKDLNANEASSALSYLLDSDIPDYQKGVFLIGERLKRESFEENSAFLQTMRQTINTHQVDAPLLVDFADPYDGFRRYPIYTPFAASLFAAMGIPAYCHGVQKVAPKYGDTIHKILALAGKNSLKPTASVIEDIEDDSVGWGYLDQSVYFPAMHDLLDLRDKIVKRPFLATLEKLLQPLQSIGTNVLVAGFVHSHYKTELKRLLKGLESLDSLLIVKGMEGSTQIDFRKKPEILTVRNGQSFAGEVEVDQISYPQEEYRQSQSLAEYGLETGIAALKGKQNVARKILVNQAVQIISRSQILEADKVRVKAKKMLDSGQAFQHWQNGCR